MSIGIIDEPLVSYRTDFAVYIGIVIPICRFMILPFTPTWLKLTKRILRHLPIWARSRSLRFFTGHRPLSLSGIIAGCMLVVQFPPSASLFPGASGRAGYADDRSRYFWNEFFLDRDWPVGLDSCYCDGLFVLVDSHHAGCAGLSQRAKEKDDENVLPGLCNDLRRSGFLFITRHPVTGWFSSFKREPLGLTFGRVFDKWYGRAVS